MNKGDYLVIQGCDKIFQIVGRYCNNIVMSDANEDSEEVLIFTSTDVEKALTEGRFRKLHKTGFKITEERKNNG